MMQDKQTQNKIRSKLFCVLSSAFCVVSVLCLFPSNLLADRHWVLTRFDGSSAFYGWRMYLDSRLYGELWPGAFQLGSSGSSFAGSALVGYSLIRRKDGHFSAAAGAAVSTATGASSSAFIYLRHEVHLNERLALGAQGGLVQVTLSSSPTVYMFNQSLVYALLRVDGSDDSPEEDTSPVTPDLKAAPFLPIMLPVPASKNMLQSLPMKLPETATKNIKPVPSEKRMTEDVLTSGKSVP